jgi:hypothetical protein
MSGHPAMCHKHDGDYPVTWCRECLRDLIARAVAAERERVAKRCCELICDGCADGMPLINVDNDGENFVHDYAEPGTKPNRGRCAAAAIRAEFGIAEQPADPEGEEQR